jgi:hypothetical protein
MNFDSRTVADSAYISLREAAKLIGCSIRKLEIARKERRLTTLPNNPTVMTGVQLKKYIEAPKMIKKF